MADTAGPESSPTKPAVLIIGGLGYIGRFLAHHIHTNSLASALRIVDKQLPQLALLSPEHLPACSEPNFVQADASRPQSIPRVFDLPNGAQFDYVFNCGGETKFSQDEQVYKLCSYDLSLNTGKEAAKRGVKAFVELSTGQVYDSKRDPRKETDKLKPTLKHVKWELAAEEDLSKMPGLNLVVLRLAHVYGPYAGRWMGTQLALARVYQDLGKAMTWLWSADLQTATVHVEDVARACWAAAHWKSSHASPAGGCARPPSSEPPTPTSPAAPKGPSSAANVFNVVDNGNTCQGVIAELVKDIFAIETGFQGTLVNAFARLNLGRVVDDINKEVLDPWARMQKEAGIDASCGPLRPFIEKELLKDADLCLDGAKFEREVGFKYNHPRVTKEEIESMIESYKRMKWWP